MTNGSEQWPAGKLEHLGSCPLCNSSKRELIHQDLTDKIFFSAPGKWNMHQCLDCKAAYLDPRPSPDSISLAYENYHTHNSILQTSMASISLLKQARRVLANGYRNWKYGTNYFPASKLGVIAAYLLPRTRRALDLNFRLMPKAWPGAKLLDVGFGNGAFLEMALAAGWESTGVDMDPVAVRNAKARGLNVRAGNLDTYDDLSEHFDVITISHVIEHLHSPIDSLRLAFKLLKPGGRLWIDTPNIESFGHARYGRHWRGLEQPRHLVIFSPNSIRRAMRQAGFCTWQEINRPEMTQPMFLASEQIRRGMNPLSDASIKPDWPTKLSAFKVRFSVQHAEYLTFIAYKPT